MLSATVAKLTFKGGDEMRLKRIKVVVPELVVLFGYDFSVPEYECTCGTQVEVDYKYCLYCGAELAWDQVRKLSKKLKRVHK